MALFSVWIPILITILGLVYVVYIGKNTTTAVFGKLAWLDEFIAFVIVVFSWLIYLGIDFLVKLTQQSTKFYVVTASVLTLVFAIIYAITKALGKGKRR